MNKLKLLKVLTFISLIGILTYNSFDLFNNKHKSQTRKAEIIYLGTDSGASFPSTTIGADWNSPDNIQASDDSRATSNFWGSSVPKYINTTNYNFSIPAGATIDGIAVLVEGYTGSPTGNARYLAQLSWDGGSSYTTEKEVYPGSGSSDIVKQLGSESDTWLRSWIDTEFSNANFELKFGYKTSSSGDYARVDGVTVTVYYTEAPANGGTDGVNTQTFFIMSYLDKLFKTALAKE